MTDVSATILDAVTYVAEFRRRAEALPDLRLIGGQLKLLIERVGDVEKKSVFPSRRSTISRATASRPARWP